MRDSKFTGSFLNKKIKMEDKKNNNYIRLVFLLIILQQYKDWIEIC